MFLGKRNHVCRTEKDQQPRVFIDPKIHIRDGKYVCDVCHVSLKSRTSLKMHKIFIHKELGKLEFLCEMEKSAQIHYIFMLTIFFCGTGDIVCRLCAKPFPTEDELSNHQIECQLKRQNNNWGDFETFECDICKMVLKSKGK